MSYTLSLPISEETHAAKYRLPNESFEESQVRFANALGDNEDHFKALKAICLTQRFMGAGRTQAAVGSPKRVTPFNCYVSGTVEDSMASIMSRAWEAAETMRMGGGIGYDFSTLRPKGDLIVSLDSRSSGPVSFMGIFDAICQTIASAGHRRGAQMGVLRVDHPDIEDFIRAKQETGRLEGFNMSIGVTDAFMEALAAGEDFPLQFDGRVYKMVSAEYLWEEIMRSTWDWAEPGVLFIDRINSMNNLYYCEDIAATNPCGEQPLPPFGACLLGSFNLTKYIAWNGEEMYFDYAQFEADIRVITRAMDNIHDLAIFPLPEQRQESHNKRRMGLGITGLANAVEALGFPYGSEEFLVVTEEILISLRNTSYETSVQLAKEKGAFPLFDKEKYLNSEYIKTLPSHIRQGIEQYGIRNSHLLSIAPTGTISLCAGNISSGIEPVFSYGYDRTIQTYDGPKVEQIQDYGYRVFNVKGKKASDCTPDEHLNVLSLCSRYVDSAVSKTINVDGTLGWEDFKDIYIKAWQQGAKGCTTFNKDGKRYGILEDTDDKVVSVEEAAVACFIDLNTGVKECG